ncbi:hypothetical protein Cgig2_027997 [Carnegiea gigantea]|uniref:Uncharacterized protein n=1 Tax=Carnegiea gigantea TaxID=171969 RepID=A0A9Q1GUU6_9CARY|nr:hypothetical protein Cgig2_027997 [Carnegiea gigantea]
MPGYTASHQLNQNGRPQGQLMPCEAMMLGRASKLSSLSGKPQQHRTFPNSHNPMHIQEQGCRMEGKLPRRPDPLERPDGNSSTLQHLFRLRMVRTKKGYKQETSLWQYNVILGHLTLNAIKAIIAPYLLLVQFELDDGRVRKLYRDKKMARECSCVSLNSLAQKEKSLTSETSQPNKAEKKVAIEVMVVLSASAEKHGRPHLKPTYKVVPIPLHPRCLEQAV